MPEHHSFAAGFQQPLAAAITTMYCAPYTQEQLLSVMVLLTQQLKGLGLAIDPTDTRAARIIAVAGNGVPQNARGLAMRNLESHQIIAMCSYATAAVVDVKTLLHCSLRLAVLRSLASFKSCIIMVELYREGVPGAEEALLMFFEALLTGIRAEHLQHTLKQQCLYYQCMAASDAALPAFRERHCSTATWHSKNVLWVVAHYITTMLYSTIDSRSSYTVQLLDVVDNIQEALAVCLDELDEILQPMLDTVLMGLLPVTRSENPKTYQLTQALLRRCFNRVYQPISQFLNSVLTGNGTGLGGARSDLSDHVRLLIWELHQIAPCPTTTTMLLFSLVLLSLHHYIDTGAPADAAVCAAKLITAAAERGPGCKARCHTAARQANPGLFGDFLSRFRDVEPKRACLDSRQAVSFAAAAACVHVDGACAVQLVQKSSSCALVRRSHRAVPVAVSCWHQLMAANSRLASRRVFRLAYKRSASH
eukprot:11761-Heterococcus_DN1.PRE.2